MGFGRRASGVAGLEQGLPGTTLVEIVVGDGGGVGGIEVGGLVEVVWGGTQGALFSFGTTEIEVEFGLGWPPCRME